MTRSYFFENIQILEGYKSTLRKETVLIKDGVIKSFGKKALEDAELLEIKPQKAKNMLLAPCLVDPHSFLESPFNGNLPSCTARSVRGEVQVDGRGIPSGNVRVRNSQAPNRSQPK